MTNYYFLASFLPDLQLGMAPEIDMNQLNALFEANLTKRDLKQVRTIKLYFDIQNIRSFWRKEPISLRGNFNESELEEALLTESGFPEYIYDYINRYEHTSDRLEHYASVLASYFSEEIPKSEGFVAHYLRFERELRLVLTALRAKKIKRDLLIELQYENSDDPFIAQIMAQKDAEDYNPPEEYEEVKLLFNQYVEDPLELHRALSEYRFNHIDSLVGLDFFSINKILAYLIQLTIIEQELGLDRQKGKHILDKIVKESS